MFGIRCYGSSIEPKLLQLSCMSLHVFNDFKFQVVLFTCLHEAWDVYSRHDSHLHGGFHLRAEFTLFKKCKLICMVVFTMSFSRCEFSPPRFQTYDFHFFLDLVLDIKKITMFSSTCKNKMLIFRQNAKQMQFVDSLH